MKGNKLCFGLLFALAITLGLSLSVCSEDTNALKHEYQGLSLLSPVVQIKHDTNNYIDWNNDDGDWYSFGTNPFVLKFEGNAWDSSLENLRVRKDLRYVGTQYNSETGQCEFSPLGFDGQAFYSVYASNSMIHDGLDQSSPDIFPISRGNTVGGAIREYSYIPEVFTGNKKCRSRSGMTDINVDSFNATYNGALPSWPNGNDLAVYNVGSVMANDNYLPYWYQTDTLPFKDSHKQSDGVTYTKSFSFDTIFNRTITSFSYFSINLDEYSGYWYDDNNLYSGRSIDFRFNFRFENPFTFEQTFLDSGSISLVADVKTKTYDPDSSFDRRTFTCTSTQRQVGENDYYWDISCPVTLSEDFIVFVPSLIIDGNGNKVFTTDGNWEFSSIYIVTDNDSSTGYSFNDSPTGNTNIWDSYWSANDNQFNPDEADWFKSLVSLFSFDFVNPFAPIFNLFNNDSCANIPTLASMLHSNETQVCPWFDSNVRNITTPVLGLASMMLVFGFVVRWLGSRSGNFIEDSGGVDIGNSYHLGNKFRRK